MGRVLAAMLGLSTMLGGVFASQNWPTVQGLAQRYWPSAPVAAVVPTQVEPASAALPAPALVVSPAPLVSAPPMPHPFKMRAPVRKVAKRQRSLDDFLRSAPKPSPQKTLDALLNIR